MIKQLYKNSRQAIRRNISEHFFIVSSFSFKTHLKFRTICHTFDRFVDSEENKFGEVFVKADSNWWVVFKRLDQRVLALFLPQSAPSNIVDVVRHICLFKLRFLFKIQHTVVDNIIRVNFHNIFLPQKFKQFILKFVLLYQVYSIRVQFIVFPH